MKRQVMVTVIGSTMILSLLACGLNTFIAENTEQAEPPTDISPTFTTEIVQTEEPTPTEAIQTEETTAAVPTEEAEVETSEGDTLSAESEDNEEESVGLIAFSSVRGDDPDNDEIYVMDIHGENLRNLTNDPAGDSAPAWSPDGTALAWVSKRDGNREIYVMQADGTNVLRLTNHDRNDTFPAWSPDGTTIAFNTDRDQNNNDEIYLMSIDGSNKRNITNSPASENFPAWSPDGSQIAFTSDRAGNRDIYIMNVDGSNIVQVTDHAAGDMHPNWSPDSTQLVFTSERDGNHEIYTMNIDGSNLQRLTNDPAEDVFPHWSPDGQAIVWRSDRDGNEEIYMMSPDGSNARRLTNNPDEDGFAAIQPIGVAPIIALSDTPANDESESAALTEDTDLPIFNDAEIQYTTQNGVEYYSNATPEDIIDFYLETIPEMDGWVFDERIDDGEAVLLSFLKDRDELIVYLLPYDNKLDVSVDLHPALTETEIAQNFQFVFPDEAEIVTASEITGSDEERFSAEFLTNLSVEEVVQFYQEAYPAAQGWEFYGYEPIREEVPILYSLFLQKDDTEISMTLNPAEDGQGISVSGRMGPITDYKDYNVPPELEPLILIIGDAKMLFAESNTAQFSSHKPLEKVRDIYQTELEAQGWIFNGEEDLSTAVAIGFEKEGQTLILNLSRDVLGWTDITLRVSE